MLVGKIFTAHSVGSDKSNQSAQFRKISCIKSALKKKKGVYSKYTHRDFLSLLTISKSIK